jgi:hypothetical protein
VDLTSSSSVLIFNQKPSLLIDEETLTLFKNSKMTTLLAYGLALEDRFGRSAKGVISNQEFKIKRLQQTASAVIVHDVKRQRGKV